MPGVLLQILLAPIAAAAINYTIRRVPGHSVGWIATGTLLYTTALVVWVGVAVSQGDVVTEEYWLIAPDIRFGLLADGLSLPTLAVVLLLCAALSMYSIRYIEHRVETIYGDLPADVQTRYYSRFFYLLPFFPVGFIGTILSTYLVTLYFFLEVLTGALFFLMAFFGYRERVRVAFISLSWGIIGALLFLVAALIVYSEIGSLEIVDLHEMAGTPLVTGAIVLFGVVDLWLARRRAAR